ncbi:hypothetical protein FGSG_07741 [Fusarium graminearum PH-1]|nr:hypothetical protein FGSG_07741 [Fusarium graminearum PH-1]ESU14045.1 hypothetical protein FGSG_07741 [Fusarium graminearum PH-1]SCB65306.1 unnamed protein product [Fusarium graminearum]|eukprot:XP_011327552.1 hypothetical protein FGSG_07741 [Fusarium graminearum PH-1]
MSDETATKFETVSDLPPSLAAAASQMVQYAGTCVELETDEVTKQDKRRFDWPSFKKCFDDYGGIDLAMLDYKEFTISRSEIDLSMMVQRIVESFVREFHIIGYENVTTLLRTTIEKTFTNLEQKSSNECLYFSKSAGGQGSFWEYGVHIAVPIPSSANSFHSFITTIKLEADVSDQNDWWGLTGSSRKNFSATMNGMKFEVEEGFKN